MLKLERSVSSLLLILVESILTRAGVTSKVDDSGQSIGRRYARTDECGIPFAITVDFDTLKDDTVTLRDLNTMKQVRMKVNILFINVCRSKMLPEPLSTCQMVSRPGKRYRRLTQLSSMWRRTPKNELICSLTIQSTLLTTIKRLILFTHLLPTGLLLAC